MVRRQQINNLLRMWSFFQGGLAAFFVESLIEHKGALIQGRINRFYVEFFIEQTEEES
jgi:hypothetical protein